MQTGRACDGARAGGGPDGAGKGFRRGFFPEQESPVLPGGSIRRPGLGRRHPGPGLRVCWGLCTPNPGQASGRLLASSGTPPVLGLPPPGSGSRPVAGPRDASASPVRAPAGTRHLDATVLGSLREGPRGSSALRGITPKKRRAPPYNRTASAAPCSPCPIPVCLFFFFLHVSFWKWTNVSQPA